MAFLRDVKKISWQKRKKIKENSLKHAKEEHFFNYNLISNLSPQSITVLEKRILAHLLINEPNIFYFDIEDVKENLKIYSLTKISESFTSLIEKEFISPLNTEIEEGEISLKYFICPINLRKYQKDNYKFSWWTHEFEISQQMECENIKTFASLR
jgi:hypothetical protein